MPTIMTCESMAEEAAIPLAKKFGYLVTQTWRVDNGEIPAGTICLCPGCWQDFDGDNHKPHISVVRVIGGPTNRRIVSGFLPTGKLGHDAAKLKRIIVRQMADNA